jgi:hypothetical protein
MNVIYNSDNYYVVEYTGRHGFELVDKHAHRSTFLHGQVAEKFVESINSVIAKDASPENIDEFLDALDMTTAQPLVYH